MVDAFLIQNGVCVIDGEGFMVYFLLEWRMNQDGYWLRVGLAWLMANDNDA